MTFEDYVRESLRRIEAQQREMATAVERQGERLEKTFRSEIHQLDVRVMKNSDEIGELDKAVVSLRSKMLLAASGVGAIIGAAIAFLLRFLEHQVIG